MTTSTPPIDAGAKPRRRRLAAGLSLVEVIVVTSISGFILAGVLSAFLMIGRTGFAASSYSEMEAQTRRALETFGNDARKAIDVRWNSAHSITLFVVSSSSATPMVTYAYDSTPGSETQGCFYRVPGDASSTLPRTVLIRNVADDFTFQRFKLEQGGVADNRASSDLETKQIQVSLRALRTGITVTDASQTALSARYLLRNKRVSN